MPLIELTVAGNEASDLLAAELPGMCAYWTVLDEGPIEDCLALLINEGGQWRAEHVRADAGVHAGRTEDGEALARHDGWIYVIGSHFGSKKGPLKPKRAFVARFRESLTPQLEIVRHQFALHRVINDALLGSVATPRAGVHASFIEETLRRGREKAKRWADQLAHGDHPVNIEGAAFTPRGTLLIGLRWPVTALGEPIIVELTGLFEDQPPQVVEVYTLSGVGTGPLGIRALSARGDGSYDVIVGSIDAPNKESVLLDQHPEARDATCSHYRFTLSSPPVLIADLAPLHNVEGVSSLDGTPLYVTDEDHRVALYS